MKHTAAECRAAHGCSNERAMPTAHRTRCLSAAGRRLASPQDPRDPRPVMDPGKIRVIRVPLLIREDPRPVDPVARLRPHPTCQIGCQRIKFGIRNLCLAERRHDAHTLTNKESN